MNITNRPATDTLEIGLFPLAIPQIAKTRSFAIENLISDRKMSIIKTSTHMISGLIMKMFSGGSDSPQSRLVDAMPNVIEEKIATTGIPKKFRADIEILQ